MNIKQIRDYIGQECLDFIRHNNNNLIFNTFTGSGKTTTILKTIYEASDGLIWQYYAPYHKVIEENIELSKVIDFNNWVHLESRKNLCLSKEYRKLAKNEINIQPFCENFCQLRDNKCPYYENLRIIREMPTCFAGVHAHIPTLLQTLLYEKWEKKCMFNYYDVIIIDEFPANTIFNQISITKNDIDYTRDVLELTEIKSNESAILMMMLDQLSLATDSIGINYGKIISMIENFRSLDFDIFKAEYDEEILDLIRRKRIKSPPKEILHFLSSIHKIRPTPTELIWMIYKTKNNQWHKGMIHLTISNLQYFNSLPIKVIALDGTADLDTWKSVLGDNSYSISFDIEYRDTYQLLGARNPVSTIVKNDKLTSSGMKMFDLLATICETKKGTVLVCCVKRVQVLLREQFKKRRIKNYMFATFFNLRSRNSYYETCDTCVIFHEPNIPPFQVEILKNILGWSEVIIRKVHREDEIKQGIGRNRQNIPVTPVGRKRDVREIYIFSSTGYKRIVPEARYMSYDDMFAFIKTGKKRLFFDNLRKVLEKNCPISKTQLRKLLGFPQRMLTHVLNVLEEDEIVKVAWGKVEYLKEIKPEKENEYLIRIGRS